MTPYYDHAGITIYHGDASEVLPGVDADSIVTDPPYGMRWQSTFPAESGAPLAPRIVGDDAYPLWVFDHLAPVANLLFCPWNQLSGIPAPTSMIVWLKGPTGGLGDVRRTYQLNYETVAFYPGPRHSFASVNGNIRPRNVISGIDMIHPASTERVHPAQKPVALMERLISHHAGSVVDPFMGVGTTLVAAKNLGRRAVGIEIDERYCEIAATRLSQEVMAL